MDDSRNVTQDGQEDVDTKVASDASLWIAGQPLPSESLHAYLTSRKTPRGGRRTARMILQISLDEVSLWSRMAAQPGAILPSRSRIEVRSLPTLR